MVQSYKRPLHVYRTECTSVDVDGARLLLKGSVVFVCNATSFPPFSMDVKFTVSRVGYWW